MHLSMLSRRGGRPGIRGGFERESLPVMGNFDHLERPGVGSFDFDAILD